MGFINPPSRHNRHHCNLVATDYVTKWVEVEATKTNDKVVAAKFLCENFMSRFGCPKELVMDKGTYFVSDVIKELTIKF